MCVPGHALSLSSCAHPPTRLPLSQLHESMNMVRDLQDQIRTQDEAQAKMTSSTRTWLLYFTLLEMAIVFGVTVWQNLYLKSFFEVKRVV